MGNVETLKCLNPTHFCLAYELLLFTICILPYLFNTKAIFTNLQCQSLFEFTHMFTDFPCSPFIICVSHISDLFVLPQVCILEIPLRKVCCDEHYIGLSENNIVFFSREIFLLEIQFWLQAIFSHIFEQDILVYSGFHSCKRVFCQSNY